MVDSRFRGESIILRVKEGLLRGSGSEEKKRYFRRARLRLARGENWKLINQCKAGHRFAGSLVVTADMGEFVFGFTDELVYAWFTVFGQVCFKPSPC
jgi:hypothetical protein